MISRIGGKPLLWLTHEQIFTSATCRLLRIKMHFVKDWYFSIYAIHAFNKFAYIHYTTLKTTCFW